MSATNFFCICEQAEETAESNEQQKTEKKTDFLSCPLISIIGIVTFL